MIVYIAGEIEIIDLFVLLGLVIKLDRSRGLSIRNDVVRCSRKSSIWFGCYTLFVIYNYICRKQKRECRYPEV
jgi:hypothetical protein